MTAYCIASTFSDNTAFQGWEVQRHTLPGPHESIRAWVVVLLAFLVASLSLCQCEFRTPALDSKAFAKTLKCQLLEEATGQKQATMKACRVWKHTLGMSLGPTYCLFVKFYPFPLVSAVPVVLAQLISCKWAWWMSAVHPQHLDFQRVEVEVASRMDTDEKKKGLSLRPIHRWDHPGFAYLRFWLCFSSFPPLYGVTKFSLDQTSGSPHSPAL